MQSTDDNATDININIVCYKFAFAYGRAFIGAAGLFAGCTAAFGGISFTVLLFSTCVANCCKEICPEKIRLYILPTIAVFQFAIGIAVVIVCGILVWWLFVPLKPESSEYVNLAFVAITVCYSLNFPWWAFQSKGSDGSQDTRKGESNGTCDGCQKYWLDTVNKY